VVHASSKYLYLLFDEDNFLHRDDSNFVFSTEGHILSLEPRHVRPMPASRKKMRPINDHQCPVYRPFIEVYDNKSADTGLVRGVRSRGDYDYARKLIGIPASSVEIDAWSAGGWCEKPAIESFVSLTGFLNVIFELTIAHSLTNSYSPLTADMYRKI
jgi:mannosidase alpha-like ER degradation enhancer 1